MQGTTLRSAFVLAAALMLAACTTTPAPKAASAAPSSPPKTALWVGNSFFYYNNSMHGHVGSLIAAANPAAKGYRATSVTISGSGINWHDMEAHFKPGGVASYSFDANNNVVFNTFDKPFDVAIMMDCSQCPIHPQLSKFFTEYAAKNSAIVRKYGAEPVFFMSWAYADKPEMTAQLAEQYTIAGNANDALVVPAGLAFAKAIARRPGLELYQPDKRHPSLAGTYLATCTTYAALRKTSPVGNTYTAGLDPELAAFLQAVAWETVQEYYGK
jgi:hypothetical protein